MVDERLSWIRPTVKNKAPLKTKHPRFLERKQGFEPRRGGVRQGLRGHTGPLLDEREERAVGHALAVGERLLEVAQDDLGEAAPGVGGGHPRGAEALREVGPRLLGDAHAGLVAVVRGLLQLDPGVELDALDGLRAVLVVAVAGVRVLTLDSAVRSRAVDGRELGDVLELECRRCS